MRHTNEQQAAAEARVVELNRLADDLLIGLDGLDAPAAKAMNDEATRLFAVAHDITAALARDEIDKAYRLSVGDDVDGEVTGLVA